MTDQFSMNSYLGQRILSLVRDGDYAHAGEEEAIDLAMAGVGKNPDRLVLDAGCGRGGTADYLHRNGWGRVIGIDVEARSIEAARQNYPDGRFLACDVGDVGRHVDEHPDVICMFNAYYCFPDQPNALAALLAVAKPQTRMVIFDHVDRGGYRDEPLMDAGQPFLPNPLRLAEVERQVTGAGWQAPALRELNAEYAAWYQNLVGRIETARDRIAAMAGEAGYDHVLGLYRGLLTAARRGVLGAAVITTAPAA